MAELNMIVEENAVPIDMEISEAQTIYENDHLILANRDAADSHPESAITGLTGHLQELQEADLGLAEDIDALERNQTLQGEQISSLEETQTSQGEQISSLEENIMLPMTAEEARNILNA